MLGFSDPKTKNIVDEKIKRKVTREEKGRDQSQRKLKDFVVTERHALFFKRERSKRATKAEHMCCCNFPPELFGAQNLGLCPVWIRFCRPRRKQTMTKCFSTSFFTLLHSKTNGSVLASWVFFFFQTYMSVFLCWTVILLKKGLHKDSREALHSLLKNKNTRDHKLLRFH